MQTGGWCGNRAVGFCINGLVALAVVSIVRPNALFSLNIGGQGGASEAFQVISKAIGRAKCHEPLFVRETGYDLCLTGMSLIYLVIFIYPFSVARQHFPQ